MRLADRYWTLLFPAILGILTTAAAARGAVVHGKVTTGGAPAAGAVVAAYSGPGSGFRGAPDHRSAPSQADGLFTLDLPAGTWYLLVRRPWRDGAPLAGDLHAYYGGNPVILGNAGTLDLGMNAAAVPDAGTASVPGEPGIRGTVLFENRPLDRARVILYREATGLFRGMGHASTFTGADGLFHFNLEPGTYWVVARKRKEGDRFGPLETGDLVAYAAANPVEVAEARTTVLAMAAVAKLAKSGEGEALLTAGGTMKGGETVLEGTVRDAAGNPLAGITVGAWLDSMMASRPNFFSRATGPDGRYRLVLAGGGTLYLAARSALGGPATSGEWLGRWSGSADHAVTLTAGEHRSPLDFTLERVQ